MNYEMRGEQIFTAKGKLAATLNADGDPVMAPGMAGAHSKGVREFLQHTERVSDQSDLSDGRWAGNDGKSVGPVGRVGQSDEGEEEVNSAQLGDGDATLYVGKVPASHVDAPAVSVSPESTAEYIVSTIPEDSLPPFSPALGSNTPGFREYCKEHSLSPEQIAFLIKRFTAKH